MRIGFYTLGCKVNQYETQMLADLFSARGYDIVGHEDPAEVYIVNSCTVTATGDQKTRKTLRHLRGMHPEARLVLTGCFPQAFPDAAALLPEADIITGTKDRALLVRLVEQNLADGVRVVRVSPHERGEAFERMEVHGAPGRTRAFVKIQDGCERYCSYCIIPTARGPVRSKPLEALKEELAVLAAEGHREVVLVGINLPFYGKDLGLRLLDAVEAACAMEGIERVRLGSLEPELLTEADIGRMRRLKKLCPQFHLSLQSGCDATLGRMNRHYTTAEYGEIVKNLRGQFENCAVTTDIMVGFPGETEAEFSESVAFAEKIAFAQAHVFAYSPRPGTRAAGMEGQLPKNVKAERSARMIEATSRTRRAFLDAQVGLTTEILFENYEKNGVYEGHTANYVTVRVKSPTDLRGRTCMVTLRKHDGDAMEGDALPETLRGTPRKLNLR